MPLKAKDMATRSSILAWQIPWAEQPGGSQSKGLQKRWTQLSNESNRNRLLLQLSMAFDNMLVCGQIYYGEGNNIFRKLRRNFLRYYGLSFSQLYRKEGFLKTWQVLRQRRFAAPWPGGWRSGMNFVKALLLKTIFVQITAIRFSSFLFKGKYLKPFLTCRIFEDMKKW